MKDFVKHVALGMDGQRGYDDSDSDTGDEDGWIPPCVQVSEITGTTSPGRGYEPIRTTQYQSIYRSRLRSSSMVLYKMS